MRRILPLALALSLIIAAGYVHGRLTDRWSDSGSSTEAIAKVALVPMDFGPWHGQAQDLDRATIERAGIAGYASRRFVNSRSGAAVSVLLVCGRPGPIAAHTPEVCYPGAGYEPRGDAERRTVRIGSNGPAAEFVVRNFARPSAPAAPAIRIFYAWNGGGAWETSENPRLSFARYPNLYKLYVVSERATPSGDDPTTGFLEEFLPILRDILS